MNDDIMLAIMITLKDKARTKEDMKLVIEEYLDWIRYSKNRYEKDYDNYEMMLTTIQAYYVLKDKEEAYRTIKLFINDLMH